MPTPTTEQWTVADTVVDTVLCGEQLLPDATQAALQQAIAQAVAEAETRGYNLAVEAEQAQRELTAVEQRTAAHYRDRARQVLRQAGVTSEAIDVNGLAALVAQALADAYNAGAPADAAGGLVLDGRQVAALRALVNSMPYGGGLPELSAPGWQRVAGPRPVEGDRLLAWLDRLRERLVEAGELAQLQQTEVQRLRQERQVTRHYLGPALMGLLSLAQVEVDDPMVAARQASERAQLATQHAAERSAFEETEAERDARYEAAERAAALDVHDRQHAGEPPSTDGV